MSRITPKEIFDEVVKEVGLRLKKLGFKQRGSVFRIAAESNCGIIEFQRSVKSSKETLLFTLNMGVVCGNLLDEGPSGIESAQIIDAHVRQRIGMLLTDRPDKWWTITESTNRDTLIQEVSDLTLTKAVPYVESYLNTNAMITLWESGQCPGLTDVQRIRFLAKLK